MTEQEFRNKYVYKAVHCDTEEKAKELLKLAHSFGWTWLGEQSLIEDTNWCSHKEGTCYRFKNNKIATFSDLDFYNSQCWEIVKFESEEKKVKKTKKVFDLGLFVDNSKRLERSNENMMFSIQNWALECHGLTKEEMSKMGRLTHDSWMKEVEVKQELSNKEIEVLKALKVLDFEWIARDKDGELFAYVSKPFKKGVYFEGNGGNNTGLEKDLFKFITWEDEEATNIEELLCGLM